MCGICGIVGNDINSIENQNIVKKMMDMMFHRGPDCEGLKYGDKFVFGHRRLSIIDIENGTQPMTSDDGLITLTYNGEIYNYVELRQELSRRGVKFKTFSDTEVLLKLYEIEGEKCVHFLNGMFAFAIFDERKNICFAARDHFGIKPFYYSFLQDKSMVFASEIKALIKHPSLITEVNDDAINEYLTFQFCINDKTLFKSINKLEPGNYFIWHLGSDKNPEIKSYWDTNYEVDNYHTDEYFLDRLLILLQDSIHQQLRSDVPVGSYLSGGLDSSTVTTLAAMQYGDNFQCFTGRFSEGAIYDESRYSEIIANNSKCKLHYITPTASDFVNLLPKLIYYMDEPVAGPGLFPQYMVSAAAAKNVRVVLGGQGGDEVFGGYTRYLVAYLEQCLKGAIYETQEEGQHVVTLNSIIPSLPYLKDYTPMLKSFWRDGLFEPMENRYFHLIDRSHDLKNILSSDMLAQYHKDKVFEEFLTIFNKPDTTSYVNKMLNFDQKTLLPALLQVEDRVSMAVSLESRVPLLDHRIIELANSLPPPFKFKNGSSKYVLRKAVENIVPDDILHRTDKKGFPVPLNEWMAGGVVRDFVFEALLGKRCKERGIFNPKGIEELLNNEKQFGRQIWGALCLELWYQIYIDGLGAN